MDESKLKPDSYLSKDAKKLFTELVEYLTEKRTLESIDSAFISACAEAGARVEKYSRIVAKEGEVQVYPSGATAPSAAYVVLHREREAFARMLKALGVTPEAREKLGIKPAAKPSDIAHLFRIAR